MKKGDIEKSLARGLPEQSPDFWEKIKQGRPENGTIPDLPKKSFFRYRFAVAASVVGICAIVVAVPIASMLKHGGAEHPVLFGEIATLGLSPLTPEELIRERITFTKVGLLNYDVVMDYRVKTDGNAEFVLPFAQYHTGVRITVDNQEVSCQDHELPATEVTRPEIRSQTQANYQSIGYLPDAMDIGYQPDDTYASLMDLFAPSERDCESILNTRFLVYDVSNCVASGSAYFTLSGDTDRRCFLFSSQPCSVSKYVGQKEGTIDCHIENPGDATYWFAVPEDADSLTVQVGGTVVSPVEKTLNEIWEQGVHGSEGNKIQAAKSVEAYLQSDYLIDKVIGIYDNGQGVAIANESYNPYKVNMMTFAVQGAGEHTVTIRYNMYGSEGDYERLQWIGSPSSMWTRTGERSVTVQIGDSTDTFQTGDEILNFIKPAQKFSAVSSADSE